MSLLYRQDAWAQRNAVTALASCTECLPYPATESLTIKYLFSHGIISDISCLCKATLNLIPTSGTREKEK